MQPVALPPQWAETKLAWLQSARHGLPCEQQPLMQLNRQLQGLEMAVQENLQLQIILIMTPH